MRPPALAIAVQHADQARVDCRRKVFCCCAGIVQGQAQVKEVQHKGESSRVCLQFPEQKLQGIQVGASVAINGTCLTVSLPYMYTTKTSLHMPASLFYSCRMQMS